MTLLEIEIAVANLFNFRRNLIVPNVSWGLGLHECDLLIVTKAGYATEVEIKTSRQDLKKDLFKNHGHKSNRIRKLYFAITNDLLEWQNMIPIQIPERAGVIVVSGNYAEIIRPALTNKEARRFNVDEIIHLGMLASMRIWSLKQTLKLRNNP